MLYAAIDIHTCMFQAAVLDSDTSEMTESRFEATPEQLDHGAMPWQGKLAVVRSMPRPVGAGSRVSCSCVVSRCGSSILAGRARCKDAGDGRRPTGSRPMALRCCSPGSFCPSASRGCHRPRSSVCVTRPVCARPSLQSAPAGRNASMRLLTHEGRLCVCVCVCARARVRLLTAEGRRWVEEGLELDACARAQVEVMLTVMGGLRSSWTRSRARCVASPAAIAAARHSRRPSGSARSWPFTCSPKSATPTASTVRANSSCASSVDPVVVESADSKRGGASPSRDHDSLDRMGERALCPSCGLMIPEACCFVGAAGGVAGAVGVSAGARERAAIDDQVFLADRATLKPAFQDLAHSGRIAGLRGQGRP
jgi:hypothetical protein